MRPRIVIIGARRSRQGIGEFVARSFAEAGAEVCGVVGKTAESAAAAAAKLAREHGIKARSYSGLSTAMDAEAPDVVAICSPYDRHFEQLREVAERGCHCLCEKPMGWIDGDPQRAVLEAERIFDRFADQGKHLALITQWPFTLEGYYEVYPEERGKALDRFEMLLGPSTTGAAAVLDSLPHVVSMLQALSDVGEVSGEIRAKFLRDDQSALRLDFAYEAWQAETRGREDSRARRAVEVRCDLVLSPAPPRPAAYALNGKRADREIELPAYTMCLVGIDGRRVALKDPLFLLVRDFLSGVEEGRPVARDALLGGLRMLLPLHAAAEAIEKKWKGLE